MAEPPLSCWKDSAFLTLKSSLISGSYGILWPIIGKMPLKLQKIDIFEDFLRFLNS